MHFYDSSSGFQSYLKAVDRFPVLDRRGELELATRYHEGDASAGEDLVNANLRNVVKIAMRYKGYGYKVSDLVAEGNMGLLQAVRRFDPERGLRFMTYASYWVKAQILAFILKSWSLVGVGTGPMQSKLFFRLHREKARLAARLGDGADLTAHLADKFECSEQRIRSMEQRIDSRDLSLDAQAYRAGGVSVVETMTETDATDQEAFCASGEVTQIVRERIATAMETFDERERRIVVSRLIVREDKRTLAELGAEMGISRERVRQLEQRVKLKLRDHLADLVDRPQACAAA